MIDPALRDDPYPYYEQLRAQGRTVLTGLALTRWTTRCARPCCAARTSAPASVLPASCPAGPDGDAGGPGRSAQPGRAAVDAVGRPAGPHALPQAGDPRLQREGHRGAARAGGGDRGRTAGRDGRESRRDRHRRPSRTTPACSPRPSSRRCSGRPYRCAGSSCSGAPGGPGAGPGADLRDFREARACSAALDGRALRPDPPLPGDDILSALVAVHDEGQGCRTTSRPASRWCCSPPGSRRR